MGLVLAGRVPATQWAVNGVGVDLRRSCPRIAANADAACRLPDLARHRGPVGISAVHEFASHRRLSDSVRPWTTDASSAGKPSGRPSREDNFSGVEVIGKHVGPALAHVAPSRAYGPEGGVGGIGSLMGRP